MAFSKIDSVEFSKFSINLIPRTVNFYDEGCDENGKGPFNEFEKNWVTDINGYFFPRDKFPTKKDVLDLSNSMLSSDLFAEYSKTLVSAEAQSVDKGVEEADESSNEWSLVNSATEQDDNYQKYKAGKLEMLLVPKPEGVYLIRSPVTKKAAARVFQQMQNEKPFKFDVHKLFRVGIARSDKLKAIAVQKSLINGQVFDNAFMPVAWFFEFMRYSNNYSEYRHRLMFQRNNSFIGNSFHRVLPALFSSSSGAEVSKSDLPIYFSDQNLVQMSCLVVNKSNDCIKYHGLVRSMNFKED